jgi:hypothetical protein
MSEANWGPFGDSSAPQVAKELRVQLADAIAQRDRAERELATLYIIPLLSLGRATVWQFKNCGSGLGCGPPLRFASFTAAFAAWIAQRRETEK